MTEQEENDVVRTDSEHHHQQQRCELGSHHEAEPIRQVRGDGLRHLMDDTDDRYR